MPGLEAKPIESVENACASGGQAVLSVIQKLQSGLGDTGIAVGYEKMRDAEGKMDGKLIGKVLGYFSHPDERPGKVFVFPHLFAEVMDCYLKTHGYREEDLATIAVQEYQNAKHNPYAQMRNVRPDGREGLPDRGHQPLHRRGPAAQDLRLLADHRRLRGPGPRDRGRPRAARREEEGLHRDRGLGPGDRPAARRRAATCCGRRAPTRAMNRAYTMAGLTPKDVNVAELHDCFTVMGAIGTEVIGKAEYGKGAKYWVDGKAAPDGECGINTSGGLIAKGHPIGATGIAMIGWCAWQLQGKAPEGAAGQEPARRGHLQHRRADLRLGLHGAQAGGVMLQGGSGGRDVPPKPSRRFVHFLVRRSVSRRRSVSPFVRYDSEDSSADETGGQSMQRFAFALALAMSTAAGSTAGEADKTSPAPEDRFLWLEDVTGEKSLDWARARNAESAKVLATPEEAALEKRILEILDSKERIPDVEKHGRFYYNFWRDAKNPRGLWRRTTLEEYRKPEPDVGDGARPRRARRGREGELGLARRASA